MTVRILVGDVRDVDLAYIAGIIDGEAYVGIKRARAYKCQGRATPSYHARIQVRMTHEGAIRFLAETLGGWYYPEKRAKANRKRLYCYQASDARAEAILRAVRPFLRVKPAVADVVLSLRDLQAGSRAHRTKVTGQRAMTHWTGKLVTVKNLSFSDEYVARCDTLYREAKRLNATGDMARKRITDDAPLLAEVAAQ